jgi:hypothetical protein
MMTPGRMVVSAHLAVLAYSHERHIRAVSDQCLSQQTQTQGCRIWLMALWQTCALASWS